MGLSGFLLDKIKEQARVKSMGYQKYIKTIFEKTIAEQNKEVQMFKFLVATAMILGVCIAQAKTEGKARNSASISNIVMDGVMVGGEAEFDACAGSGIVLATTTLFTLKSGQMFYDKVDINTHVYTCDSSEDGNYVGIVYGKKGQNCGVSSSIPKRQKYKGPCKSGWIKKEFFELIFG